MRLITGCPGWLVRVSGPGLALTCDYTALVDTGASHCVISPKVQRDLVLPTIDTAHYSSASHSKVDTSVHRVFIEFELSCGASVAHDVRVTKMGRQPEEFDVILGMDVPSQYRLELVNDILTLEHP